MSRPATDGTNYRYVDTMAQESCMDHVSLLRRRVLEENVFSSSQNANPTTYGIHHQEVRYLQPRTHG
jgi:hypothetical protein